MEKYSKFNDPFTGINPFLNPKRRPLSVSSILLAFLKFPMLLFLWISPSYLFKLKKIHCTGQVIAANSSSYFETFVLRYVLRIRNFYYATKTGFADMHGNKAQLCKPCVVFVEGCTSNNKMVLQYVRNVQVDHVCCLRWSPSCIGMYGSIFVFLLHFLAGERKVEIFLEKTEDLSLLPKLGGFLQSSLGVEDKSKFYEELTKKKSKRC